MDNMPRLMPGYNVMFTHGHMVWADTCFQAILNCRISIKICRVLGRESEICALKEEQGNLTDYVNKMLWDDNTSFYYELWKDGKLNGVKIIGAYWSLISGAVPEKRLGKLVKHLENSNEF